MHRDSEKLASDTFDDHCLESIGDRTPLLQRRHPAERIEVVLVCAEAIRPNGGFPGACALSRLPAGWCGGTHGKLPNA
ncbi:hypothetical protein A8H40_10395 [Burkholderia multivorans]|nr:hypothetical protein A8H40_10395 [Burkholderia multivorans]